MLVIGLVAVAVIDDHGVAHRALVAGVLHRAAVCRDDRGAVGAGDVDAHVVCRRAADARVAVSEAGGQAAGGRPAEGAGGHPARTLLGAAGAGLGLRRGQHDLRNDRALRFDAVDVLDVRHDVRRAIDARLDHAGVALIHRRVVDIGDVVVDLIDVVLTLRDLDGQVGDLFAQHQLVADVDAVDVVAGVQRQQLVVRHAVAGRDLGPGVAADDGVGLLIHLRAVDDLGDVAEIHQTVGGDVALADAHVLDEVDGQRVLRGADLGDLVQQRLDGALILRGAHELVVDIERVAVGDESDLVGQLLFEIPDLAQLAAADEAAGVLDRILVKGVGPAQRVGGQLLHARRDELRLGGVADDLQRLALVAHGGAGGVEREERGDGGEHQRHSHESQRAQTVLMRRARGHRRVEAEPVAAATDEALLRQRLPHREQPWDQQEELHDAPVRLRKAARVVLAQQRFRSLPQGANTLPKQIRQRGDPREQHGDDLREGDLLRLLLLVLFLCLTVRRIMCMMMF